VTGCIPGFIGGGLDSTLRPSTWSARVFSERPFHTFIINITGSTVMGLIAGYLAFKAELRSPGAYP
jgi:CrcB protein